MCRACRVRRGLDSKKKGTLGSAGFRRNWQGPICQRAELPQIFGFKGLPCNRLPFSPYEGTSGTLGDPFVGPQNEDAWIAIPLIMHGNYHLVCIGRARVLK